MLTAMKGLARLKFLRGTRLDPFGRTAERRMERALIRDFEAVTEALIAGLAPETHALAVEIASLPTEIRGFGPVKLANHERVRRVQKDLLDRFRKQLPAAATGAGEPSGGGR